MIKFAENYINDRKAYCFRGYRSGYVLRRQERQHPNDKSFIPQTTHRSTGKCHQSDGRRRGNVRILRTNHRLVKTLRQI